MSNKYDDLRNQIKTLFDSTDDRTVIESIGGITEAINKLEEEHTSTINENKELLGSYKELVKHVSFAPNDTNKPDAYSAGTTAPISFDECLADFIKSKK